MIKFSFSHENLCDNLTSIKFAIKEQKNGGALTNLLRLICLIPELTRFIVIYRGFVSTCGYFFRESEPITW